MSLYDYKDMRDLKKKNDEARKFNYELTHDKRADIFYESEEEKMKKRIAVEEKRQELNEAYLRGKEVSLGSLLYPEMTIDRTAYKSKQEESPRDDYANPWAGFFGSIDGFEAFHAALVRNDYNPYYAWRETKGSEEGLQEFIKFYNSYWQ